MEINSIRDSDVIYRCLGENLDEGIISCGFMRKKSADRSQYDFVIGYYSCFLLLDGAGTYSDDKGNICPITAGDLVQRIPGQIHTTEIVPDGRWLEFYISIGAPVYTCLRRLGIIRSLSPVIRTGMTHQIVPEFRALLKQLQMAEADELPQMMARAQEMLIRMHQSCRQSDDASGADDSIHRACQIISSANNVHYDIREAAKAVNLGYENFRKLFKQQTGSSPQRYQTEQLMKQARMMLVSGISIKETAITLGYSDVYSFTKQFTRHTQIPPGRYAGRRKGGNT